MMATALVQDLVTRAREGDADALEQLAIQELPRVERLLGRVLGPRHDFEDLVQTVFLELCRALPRFRGESAFSTFVGGITLRVARRALRPPAWAFRRGAMPRVVADETQSHPEETALASERYRQLHVALDRLTPKKRVAFTLWALDGMSPREIGELTGASIHTVRSRIFHARHELMDAAQRDPILRELFEQHRDAQRGRS